MIEFKEGELSSEDAFWIMWYFLKENYDLSGGAFEVSDILSASEPVRILGSQRIVPIDSGMINFWNNAIEKFRKEGKPPLKTLS